MQKVNLEPKKQVIIDDLNNGSIVGIHNLTLNFKYMVIQDRNGSIRASRNTDFSGTWDCSTMQGYVKALTGATSNKYEVFLFGSPRELFKWMSE